MNVSEVMDMLSEIPFEDRDRTQVKIQIYDIVTDEVWTQEQHDALDANFELLLTPMEE